MCTLYAPDAEEGSVTVASTTGLDSHALIHIYSRPILPVTMPAAICCYLVVPHAKSTFAHCKMRRREGECSESGSGGQISTTRHDNDTPTYIYSLGPPGIDMHATMCSCMFVHLAH